MSAPTHPHAAAPTAYEEEQIRAIAAWKSEPPNPFGELFGKVTGPGVRLVETLIPDRVVEALIDKAYDVSDVLAGRHDVARRAGVKELDELRSGPLEECDRLARRVGTGSQILSTVEGLATGAGGPLTTLIDIPLLFVVALRTVLKIGHCYGYPLESERDRRYVLGVLLAATSGTLVTRRERLARLREVEEWLLEETQQDVIAQELASLLFQLEVFEAVPGAGAVSGAALNLAFIRRVDVTARRVFQERWLRDNGKVDEIAPAEAHPRALAVGWSGAWTRAVYRGCYLAGFGVTLPAWYVASLFGRSDNAATRGLSDGAAAARDDAESLLGPARRRGSAPGLSGA